MTERQDLRGQETEHTEQTADHRAADRKLEDCGATVKKTTQRTHRRRRLPFFCFFPSFLFLFFVLVLRERKTTDYQAVEMLINLNFRANEEKLSRSGETSNKIKTLNKAIFCKVLQPFMYIIFHMKHHIPLLNYSFQ